MPITAKTVAILPGCRRQLGIPAPARELYQSPMFLLMRAWAQSACAQWAILSVVNGLVMPDDKIAPYARALEDLSLEQRKAWGKGCVSRLKSQFGESAHFVALVPEPCLALLDDLKFDAPLRGKSVAEAAQWLKDKIVLHDSEPTDMIGAARVVRAKPKIQGPENVIREPAGT